MRLTVEGNVEAVRGLAKLVQRSNSLVIQVNLLEVLGNASLGDRLGDDGVAANLGPGEDDLGGGDGLALLLGQVLGDGLDLVGVDEQRDALGVVAKGGVGGDDDALLGAVLDQGRVGETRVALDLVGGGDDAGGRDNGLELYFYVSYLIVGVSEASERRTCSMVKLETPTARALDLGSSVMAFQV